MLDNLAGFTMMYGTSPDDLSQTVRIDNPSIDRYMDDLRPPGTYLCGEGLRLDRRRARAPGRPVEGQQLMRLQPIRVRTRMGCCSIPTLCAINRLYEALVRRLLVLLLLRHPKSVAAGLSSIRRSETEKTASSPGGFFFTQVR